MIDERFIEGHKYEVRLSDCCIDARFIARFIGYSEDNCYLFENGVIVERIGASDIYEVFDEAVTAAQ